MIITVAEYALEYIFLTEEERANSSYDKKRRILP